MKRRVLAVPADLLQAVDLLVHRTGQKRSEIVRQALRDLIERQRQQEFQALLAEGYQATARQAAKVDEDAILAQAEAAEWVWRWDD